MFDLTFSHQVGVDRRVMEDPRIFEAQAKAVAHASPRWKRLPASRISETIKSSSGKPATSRWPPTQHDTSRQLDPQIHTHAVLFNLSHDKETDSWKALHSPSVYQRRAYITEVTATRWLGN